MKIKIKLNFFLFFEKMLGSPLYMSPEVLNEQPYDRKSDMVCSTFILYYTLQNNNFKK